MATYKPAYRLTVYAPRSADPTEATVLTPPAGAAHSDQFKVTTLASLAGWKPYLLRVPTGRRGRLDLLTKHTDVGVCTQRVLDARLTVGGSNLSRWVAAFFGTTAGNPSWLDLKAWWEESLDGGATWADYFVGRLVEARLVRRLTWEFTAHDATAELGQMRLFIGRPHPSVGAPEFSLLPVGFTAPYGAQLKTKAGAATVSNRATKTSDGRTFATGTLTLSAVDRSRPTNIRLQALEERLAPTASVVTALGGIAEMATITPSNLLRAKIKRTDTGLEGEFRVGLVTVELAAVGIHRVVSYVIESLKPPLGIATGTPLVQGAHSVSDTTIVIDGWTASQTGIVKAGDLLWFAGHVQRYVVQADADSDGGGVATVTIAPGLKQSLADNEVVRVEGEPGYMDVPANGTACEFYFVNNGPIDERHPVLVNDRHVAQVFRDVLDGYFGHLWQAVEDVPVGKAPGDPKWALPYDASAFSTLIADDSLPTVRLLETEGRQPAGDFVERVLCLPTELGYYVNASGQVVPLDLRLPASLSGLPTITDADLVEGSAPAWEHRGTDAVTRVSIRYYEDAAEQIEQTILQKIITATLGDIISREFALLAPREHRLEILDAGAPHLADRAVQIDARGHRWMTGELKSSQAHVFWRQRQLIGAAYALTRPYSYGAQAAVLRLRRSSAVAAAATTLPGKLVLVAVSSLPDPASHARGGTRLMRVVERTEEGLAVPLRLLDSGEAVVSAVPSLGTPAQQTGNTKHGAVVVLTLGGSGAYDAEVHYAVTATSVGSAPAEASSLWTFAARSDQSRTVVVEALPAGRRIWFRARSVPATRTLRLPSAWVAAEAPGYVDLAALTAPSGIGTANISAKRAEVTFTPGEANLHVAVYLASPATDPLARILRLPPGTSRFFLEGLVASTEYKVEVRTDDLLGGESAGVNTTFNTTSTPATAPAAGRIVVLAGE